MDVISGLATRLGRSLAGERDRWILWTPVAVLFGIVCYFWLPSEPWPWAGLALFGAFVTIAVVIRQPVIRLITTGLALAALGLTLAQVSMLMVSAPVLQEEIGPRPVSGRIETVDVRSTGTRIVMTDLTISGLEPEDTPARVRISIRTHGDAPEPGRQASILAMLQPPSAPTWPGGFDFGRRAFFVGIGGVGYAVGPLEIDDTAQSASGGWHAVIESVRHHVTDRILMALDEPTGAVAAALLTGQRSAVPEPTLDTIRRAGLAHLLAISGLHLGLVAAVLFIGFRTAAAAIEPLALSYPIKNWAAVFALVGTFLYLMLSGATVPTQRAFIMTAIVLIAIVIHRDPFSMRLVAVAAFVVMIIAPVSVLGPSFQLSFAAVIALIAAYEAIRERWPAWRARRTFGGRIVLYVVGLSLTTVIANAATAGFVLAHFNRWALYGLLANLAAVPVTAFWVMPWGLLSLALMPFGLESLALVPMGWGIDIVLLVAQWTAEQPGAVLHVSSPPAWLPAVLGLGLLWICLWRSRLRWWGLVPIAASLVIWSAVRGPDLLVSGDARLVAVRDQAGDLILSSYRRETFIGNSWLAMAGQENKPPWPDPGDAGSHANLRCDGQACIYLPLGDGGPHVAIVEDAAVLGEDCHLNDYVVSLVPSPDHCAATLGVIDRFDLWRAGTHALWFSEDGVIVKTVAGVQGKRPWTHWPADGERD